MLLTTRKDPDLSSRRNCGTSIDVREDEAERLVIDSRDQTQVETKSPKGDSIYSFYGGHNYGEHLN